MKNKIIIFFVFMLFILTGCSEIRYAKAAEIRSATRRKNDVHQVRMSDSRALFETRVAAKQTFIWSVTLASATAVLGGVGIAGYCAMGRSMASVRKANLEASLIALDPATRQFPLYTYEIRGVKRLHDPNTYETRRLDRENEALPRLIVDSGNVKMTGVIAEAGQQPNIKAMEVTGEF